jgi:hypothetical protein
MSISKKKMLWNVYPIKQKCTYKLFSVEEMYNSSYILLMWFLFSHWEISESPYFRQLPVILRRFRWRVALPFKASFLLRKQEI